MHEKHRGHEKMHAYMILILLASVVVAQIVLVQWKKRHFKSYQRASMLGMWLIPLCVSVHSHWWRFVFIWSIFTLFTCIVVSWALQKPIAGTTPRWVYKWFYVVHMQSGIAGIYNLMKACCGGGILILRFQLPVRINNGNEELNIKTLDRAINKSHLCSSLKGPTNNFLTGLKFALKRSSMTLKQRSGRRTVLPAPPVALLCTHGAP
ncbi:hypothetical protein HPB47_020832 [Ixodes persulcatus]|uniref:Uncharacterized protein n=1 Tax=Ixodes persulcatus TaxID=34615 RepID=A0AC60QGC5_IXOPE|nr:hypothetical protein HPB47_020832 [Ixodes persulcatus]